LKILVVQESDWVEVGPHDTHHLLERLSQDGNQVRVIDYHVRWYNSKESSLFSKRTVRQKVHKAIPGGDITVITPAFIRAPLADYLSILFSHYIEIKKQIRKFRPDIIIGLGIINTNAALRLAKKHKIPLVHYVLDELHQLVPQKRLQPLARLVERDNLSNSDLVISTNQGMREYCLDMGSKIPSTAVLKHGVEFDKYAMADGSQIRHQLGLVEGDLVLFFMGWLYTFSGLDIVARMIAESDDPHLKILIVGNGELWDSLQEIKQADKIGDRIITVGWKPYPEMPSYIAASDICILPAQNNRIMENIVPIKIIEYMAARKPVIATELPGLVKEFGPDSGIAFIKLPDETIIAAYSLVEHGGISENGRKAQDAVKDNNWDVLVPEFKSLLVGLVEPNSDQLING
jgi:glycosyltransferase involved in cell wall biosynthesis